MKKLTLFGLALIAWLASPSFAQDSASGQSGNDLPPDFVGKVHYFGNNNGTIAVIGSAPGKKSDACPRPDGGCPKPIGGSLDVELEFDGAVVKGTYRGTGGLHDGALIGRRNGSICRLFDMRDGSVWSGRCDLEGFTGRVKSVPNAATQIDLMFEALGTEMVDYVERDKEAALKQRIAYLIPIAQGTGPLAPRMAALAELEGYATGRYAFVQDSLGPIELSRKSDGGHSYLAYATFSTQTSQGAWVRVRIERDTLKCVETSFSPGDCHPPMIPGGGQAEGQ